MELVNFIKKFDIITTPSYRFLQFKSDITQKNVIGGLLSFMIYAFVMLVAITKGVELISP